MIEARRRFDGGTDVDPSPSPDVLKVFPDSIGRVSTATRACDRLSGDLNFQTGPLGAKITRWRTAHAEKGRTLAVSHKVGQSELYGAKQTVRPVGGAGSLVQAGKQRPWPNRRIESMHAVE